MAIDLTDDNDTVLKTLFKFTKPASITNITQINDLVDEKFESLLSQCNDTHIQWVNSADNIKYILNYSKQQRISTIIGVIVY